MEYNDGRDNKVGLMATRLACDRAFTEQTLIELVRINSINPTIASSGPGEAEIASYIASALARLGLETAIYEPQPGRATAVGTLVGTGGGRSLMNKPTARGRLLMRYYNAMAARFGHRNWWPGDSPFEVCVGAILTQNTAWTNVAKAIRSLKEAPALDPSSIYQMSHDRLAQLIRPAGYFNVKAVRLKNFVSHLVEKHDGSLESLFSAEVPVLREELLSIRGVGRETADSIILYAAGKPIFVVDAYTKRVLERHALMDGRADYDAVQDLFHANLPKDSELYNDFHAQFVTAGHHYCKKSPKCSDCPLNVFKKVIWGDPF